MVQAGVRRTVKVSATKRRTAALIELVRVSGRQPEHPAEGEPHVPLTAGEPFEGEPAIDFSGSRILVELEVWLQDRDHPLVRTLSVSAC